MTLIDQTNPSVSLADVKRHLRIEHDLDDVYLASLIPVATSYCSNYIGVAPYSTWEATQKEIDSLPNSLFLPERPYLIEIDYYSGTNVITIETDTFNKTEIDLLYNTGKQTMDMPKLWKNPIKILAYVGIPKIDIATLYQAELLLIADMYLYREDSLTIKTNSIPNGIKTLLDIIMKEV